MLLRSLLALGALCVVLLAPARAGVQDAAHEQLAGLVAAAERIADFEVLEAQPLLRGDGVIETRYLLATRTRLKGASADLEELRMPGGEVAGRGLIIPGLPRLEVGDRAILFLSARSHRGWRFPVGLRAGVLPTRVDGARLRAEVLAEVQQQER